MTRNRTLRGGKLTALAVAALLAACGGGSSEEATPIPTGPPGTLDATFGTGGIVLSTPSSPATANAIVLQPDGKVVVAGSIGDGAAKSFYLSRYKPDGTLDAGFGSGGTIITIFDPVAGSEARAVALQPDGRIVAAGGSGGACVLARYNPDGSLDSGFGAGGIVVSRSAGGNVACAGIALQPDGGIVTAVDHGPLGYRAIGQTSSVMRFLAVGRRDESFGVGGEATVDCGYDTRAAATFGCRVLSVAVRSQGGLVIGGSFWQDAPFGGAYALMVGQLKSDGSPDPGFGLRGYSIAYATCSVGSLVLQPDGRIVAAAGEVEDPPPPYGCFSIARFLADGEVDSGFGSGGMVPYPKLGDRVVVVANAVALQDDGKIVAAGDVESHAGDGATIVPPTIAVFRFAAGGGLDVAFAGSGVAKTPLGTSASGRAVAIMSDGRIIVAGSVINAAGTQEIFVARYFGDSVTPSTH